VCPLYKKPSTDVPLFTKDAIIGTELEYDDKGGIFHHLRQSWIMNKGIFHLLVDL
jgi:hypothetical protein